MMIMMMMVLMLLMMLMMIVVMKCMHTPYRARDNHALEHLVSGSVGGVRLQNHAYPLHVRQGVEMPAEHKNTLACKLVCE